MIRITIENVGKIRNASVEIQGISVIAGLNGTGKSTIAKSIFAALNSRKNIGKKIWNDQSEDVENVIENWLVNDTNASDITNIWEASMEITEAIMKLYVNEQRSLKEGNLNNISKTIKDYCGSSSIDFVEDNVPLVQIADILNRDRNAYVQFFVGRYYQDVFRNQINNLKNSSAAKIQYCKSDSDRTIMSEIELRDNAINIDGKLLGVQQENAVYIETQNVLDNCEFRHYRGSVARAGRKRSLPTEELVEYLFAERELSFSEQKEVDKNRKIIDTIVNQVTHGYLIKEKTGSLGFVETESNQKIEFSNMSSGLKIFTVIQKLLENYSLKAGDVLLVDEPEVNLHPEWQVALADIMVRIYKELGIYIVINSHSPYFIRAIEVKMGEYGCALNGRYYFMEEAEGCVCRDVSNSTETIYQTLYKPLESL